MKPLQSVVRSVMLAPAAAATTARTANLDCSGADYAVIEIVLSAEVNTNSTNVALRLLESDTTVATTFATFNSAFNVTLDNTAAGVHVANVDLKGNRKRYLRVELTPDTTTNGAVLSTVVGVLDPEIKNAANSSNATTVLVG
jgi:hypothetical protein